MELRWNGDDVLAEIRDANTVGLLLGAEYLLGEARRIVPIEEATLERSGAASVDEIERVAAVSFDTPYAVEQHENLTLRHDEGRQAKYLETPMMTRRSEILELVAGPAQDLLGS